MFDILINTTVVIMVNELHMLLGRCLYPSVLYFSEHVDLKIIGPK